MHDGVATVREQMRNTPTRNTPTWTLGIGEIDAPLECQERFSSNQNKQIINQAIRRSGDQHEPRRGCYVRMAWGSGRGGKLRYLWQFGQVEHKQRRRARQLRRSRCALEQSTGASRGHTPRRRSCSPCVLWEPSSAVFCTAVGIAASLIDIAKRCQSAHSAG